ncbi:hypothetical protein HF263_30810 [Rhizobium leguminosarum]|uniref:hypothetical protein n=1 Tax=Rhizobium leguminosarum TaxID=384 RepID=UPI001C922F52|nr:hypothetical protein [Rhizobium leguminosarum]MBY3060401.1 hypothetical protein [Rhizobium leguminosarum]
MRLPALTIFAAPVLAFLASPCLAADNAFSYKTSYRNVTSDPDKIWTGDALAPSPKGTVTIHEYQLRTAEGDWLISQIWNDDCSSGACPTRLLRVAPNGERQVVVDDMMHQIVPPDDPRFGGMASNKAAEAFARQPFALSDNGKTLVNGDFKFQVGGSKP